MKVNTADMSTFPKKNYESPSTVEIEIKTGKPLLNNSQYCVLLLLENTTINDWGDGGTTDAEIYF